MKIAFILGSLEAGRDGVGDYTRALAQECVRQGHNCVLVAFSDKWIQTAETTTLEVEGCANQEIEMLRLPSSLSWNERTDLAEKFLIRFQPELVSLQFVPYAFNKKGVIFGLLCALRPLFKNRRVHIMFHELWIGAYTTAMLKERLVGKLQKQLILKLTRALRPHVIHTSNETYVALLSHNGVMAQMLPLFGSIPIAAHETSWLYEAFERSEIDLTETSRKQWWVFGFFGSLSSAWPAEPLFSHVCEAAKSCNRNVLIASAGRTGDEGFWKRLEIEYSNRFRFLKLGELPTEKVSQYLQFIDFGIAAAPLALIGKSSVVAAMIEHGLPVIANRDEWHLPFEYEVLNPTKDRSVHKLDDTMKDRLISGSPTKQEPEQGLAVIAGQFLNSLSAIQK